MARGRVYKFEVKIARDALLRQGTNPSLDAVRIALGNTGSKTTIHRLMKELEAEEDSVTALAGEVVSDALQALVGQLAAQLRQEAEATVAAGQTRAEAQVAAALGEVTTVTQQAREASDQIQRLQITLADTHQALATTEQVLRERDTTIVGLHEHLAGLERQLAEREAHLASVETKHVQARDALDHFRQASKEQREIEARQREQAVQALQVGLRRATDSVATKNDELLTLNRDHARLTQQAGQQDKELRVARRALLAAQGTPPIRRPCVRPIRCSSSASVRPPGTWKRCAADRRWRTRNGMPNAARCRTPCETPEHRANAGERSRPCYRVFSHSRRRGLRRRPKMVGVRSPPILAGYIDALGTA